jgi:hypothetical protein
MARSLSPIARRGYLQDRMERRSTIPDGHSELEPERATSSWDRAMGAMPITTSRPEETVRGELDRGHNRESTDVLSERGPERALTCRSRCGGRRHRPGPQSQAFPPRGETLEVEFIRKSVMRLYARIEPIG